MCSEKSFFVIEEEGFYCTVPYNDIVCDDSVKVGDKVIFSWGNRKPTEGIVKFIGATDDECVAKCKELKSREKQKKKASDSFHEDKPRKSAVKCSERISVGASTSRKRKGKTGSSLKKKTREGSAQDISDVDRELLDMLRQKKESKYSSKKAQSLSENDTEVFHNDDDGSTMDLDANANVTLNRDISAKNDDQYIQEISTDSEANKSDSSSVNDESSDEDIDVKKQKLLAKVAAKMDLKALQELDGRSRKSSSDASKQTLLQKGALSKPAAAKPCPRPALDSKALVMKCNLNPTVDSGHVASSVNLKGSGDLKVDSGSESDSKSKQKVAGKAGPSRSSLYQVGSLSKSIFENRFSGEMFRPKEKGSVLLDEANQIYCDKLAHDQAEGSESATKAARRLMEGVFTLPAMLGCSVTGMPPRGKGKIVYTEDKTAIKPPLCPKGVKAILDTALAWQDEQKTWRPRRDIGYIKRSLGLRLKEIQGQNPAEED